uniref:Uncharacterized protein n=1 Tax=Setaria digitata TaxID=48799 RepID=A0A915PV39_9BILA
MSVSDEITSFTAIVNHPMEPDPSGGRIHFHRIGDSNYFGRGILQLCLEISPVLSEEKFMPEAIIFLEGKECWQETNRWRFDEFRSYFSRDWHVICCHKVGKTTHFIRIRRNGGIRNIPLERTIPMFPCSHVAPSPQLLAPPGTALLLQFLSVSDRILIPSSSKVAQHHDAQRAFKMVLYSTYLVPPVDKLCTNPEDVEFRTVKQITCPLDDQCIKITVRQKG